MSQKKWKKRSKADASILHLEHLILCFGIKVYFRPSTKFEFVDKFLK